MDITSQAAQYGRPVSNLEAARANEYFEQFLNATSLKQILGYYRGLIDYLHLKPNVISLFYAKLRTNLTSWRAKALWKKFDARAAHKCYQKGIVAANTRVLIIGGGPCGLRTAIEAQLLGAKVVVIEKRDRFSRNNVLHLWPFVIEDLRMLGAKKFFGKFCAGAIDHISIRQLQCILLKVALLLGVEVHTEVGFEKLIEPSAIEKTGWRAEFKPSDHPVSHYEFDVIIGADGKRNTLQGFTRKEFRGKLAIAITANFINKRTEAEARVEEISGVAFIFNQKFFKDLLADTRIDLENIVYYKDDTHYFVMTAKKASLLEKGVIKQDLTDTEKLLAPENVNRNALEQYAIEAANFSTNHQMPDLEFAVNHYGQPDIAMFDFTSMYAADNASKVLERNGHRLLMILVGDSLLEPFWPTGSGCARGFLSALDAAWAIRSWSSATLTPLDVIAERESIYRLLAQTTPDNLNKDWKSYTCDPATRYPNLNKAVVLPLQVAYLYDTDNSGAVERMKRASNDKPGEVAKKRRRGTVDNEVLMSWLTEQLKDNNGVQIDDIGSVFKDGRILCSIIHHYRPDLLDINSVVTDEPITNNQLAIDILEKELGIPPVMTGADITNTDDYLTMASYLTEIYDTFRGEIPHIKQPKLRLPVRFTKSLIPPKIKSSIGSHDLKLKPCKKCSDAYNSEMKLCTAGKSEIYKSKICKEHIKPTKLVEKNVEVVFVKPGLQRRCKKCLIKNQFSTKNIQRVPSNCSKIKYISQVELNENSFDGITPRKKDVNCNLKMYSKPVNVGNEYLKKYANERKEKLRKFMSKLMVQTKNTNPRKCSLSVIPEAKMNIETGTIPIEVDICENQKHDEKMLSEEIPNKQNSSSREIPRLECNVNISNVSTVISNDIIVAKSDAVESSRNKFKPKQKRLMSTKSNATKTRGEISESESLIRIQLIERQTSNKIVLQKIEFVSSLNQLTISSRVGLSNVPSKSKMLSNHKYAKFRSKVSNHQKQTSTMISGPNIADAPGSNINKVPTSNYTCQIRQSNNQHKFWSKRGTMFDGDGMHSQIYSRVSNWISSNDFLAQDNSKADTEVDTVISNSKITDITSVSKMDQYDAVKVEERTDVVNCSDNDRSQYSEEKFSEKLKFVGNKSVRTLSKFSQYSPFQYGGGTLKSVSAPPKQFSVIVEGPEETELPESKISELSFKTIRTANMQPLGNAPPRPSSRHKRHVEMPPVKPLTADRKARKRRTIERVGPGGEDRQKTLDDISSNRAERHNRRRQQRKLQTEQFLKSMQMLQANAKEDAQPFEDYSIFLYRQTAPKFEDRVKDLEKQFTYIPDHENKSSSQNFRGGGADDDLAARIKSLENKWREPVPVEKKPKDLLRAIGKIETSDWNIKEIEKKIMENKLGKPNRAVDKEKVPKWSKEQFIARQTKMEKQHLDRQDSSEAKYADIDKGIRNLDQKLKEGTVRELGRIKVATITEKLASKVPAEPKPVEKNTTRPPPVLPVQGGSDFCHFCGNRVYLMERLSAEGRFFHHGCFKCQYCHIQLRLGSYAFDRDGLYGNKFFCLQHFGMIGEAPSTKVTRKTSVKLPQERRSPEKRPGIAGVDLLDKVHTPERIEFSNLSVGQISSDHDDSCQMDEDEWTDKNFGASCAEFDDTDDDSSSMSDSGSDDDNAYDDALEEPVTKEGTMKWAERWKNSYSRKKHNIDSNGYSSSDHSSYCENSSDDDDSDTATEGEEEIRARELRKREVCVEPPIVHTDTGTDTEIVSDETSSDTSSKIQNSATEISTDSEFAQDDPTPTREVPSIVLNDFHVTKTRGSGRDIAKKIQVTTGYLQKPFKGKARKSHIELKLKPLVSPAPKKQLPAPGLHSRTEGYMLNRTQSTGGIATKVSLELKKKYLLGEDTSGSIQKSGSASTLDTKFKSFHTNISDCQKMLKPSTEISASMQTFCNLLNDRTSPVSFPQPSVIFDKDLTNKSGDNDEPSTVPTTDTYEFRNESEGRPRSPLHETSIIVPQIDWSKKDHTLSSDSLASTDSENEADSKQTHSIPRVKVHPVHEGDSIQGFATDSLSQSDPRKSIASEKKSLNKPKTLPNLENLLPEIHNSLHNKYKALELKTNTDTTKPESGSFKSLHGFSSPESEQVTAALTETELSDWARDEVVSDDFEDGDFEVNEDFQKAKCPFSKNLTNMAKLDEINIREQPIGELKDKTIITEAMNSILSGNLDIEFMDTGSETSSDDGNVDSQDGYVLLKNDTEFAGDSLNPSMNEIHEATNIYVKERIKSHSQHLEQLTEVDTSANIEKVVQDEPRPHDPVDNILLIMDSGTTTEENTCSDSTVKNITEISSNKQTITQNESIGIAVLPNMNVDEKLAMSNNENKQNIESNLEFQEHCQRLQSKVEFSNVKDSIDVRKSRRKSKPDLIQGEPEVPHRGVTVFTPITRTPDILYNKETLKRERDTNQRLIQEMVMNKMKTENKSFEKKKRRSISSGPSSPRALARCATAGIISESNNSSSLNTPDVLLSTNYPLKNSKSINISPASPNNSQTPIKLKIQSINDNHNIFDQCENLNGETPKPPPRQNRSSDDVLRKLEKLKNVVRSSLEQENVEPLECLKTPVINADKRNSWLHSNSNTKMETTPVRFRHSENYELSIPAFNNPFSSRTKSIPDFSQNSSHSHVSYEEETMKIFKSDPNIPNVTEKIRKRSKDPERRKSFSKIFSTIFSKKSTSSSESKGFFSKLSPKMKEVSKDPAVAEPIRKKSSSESYIYRTVTPPPVPPLPLNYEVKKTDESSEGEQDYKKLDLSSCDTLDQTEAMERSSISLNEKRSSKSRRASRQTQYKRHRMAQEIQRKLEETEVKTKELERRGVSVERALRGEGVVEAGSVSKEDSDLMQEWFDLMRDRTELRRYERELIVRAKELELEDRHARLQHELRERIEDSKAKNEDDLKLEESIINEMIEIVEKRDSLIAEIEEDRIRYSNEDRDLEEQMLAKGLRLTPLKKSSEK